MLFRDFADLEKERLAKEDEAIAELEERISELEGNLAFQKTFD